MRREGGDRRARARRGRRGVPRCVRVRHAVRACALTALLLDFHSAECGPARDVLATLSPGATVGGGAGSLGAPQPGARRVSALGVAFFIKYKASGTDAHAGRALSTSKRCVYIRARPRGFSTSTRRASTTTGTRSTLRSSQWSLRCATVRPDSYMANL